MNSAPCDFSPTMRRRSHPKVMEAIAAANRLDTAYDGDEWSRRLDGAFSDLFGTEVRAFWVTTRDRRQLPRARRSVPALSRDPLPHAMRTSKSTRPERRASSPAARS